MEGSNTFINQQTTTVLASVVLALFFTFYNKMYITSTSYFCVCALFILIMGVVAYFEMKGVVILLVLIFWYSIGERVTRV
jgi:hypothetical protein